MASSPASASKDPPVHYGIISGLKNSAQASGGAPAPKRNVKTIKDFVSPTAMDNYFKLHGDDGTYKAAESKPSTPAKTNPKSKNVGAFAKASKEIQGIPGVRTVPSETASVEEADENYEEWEVVARIIDVREQAQLKARVKANISQGDIVEGHRDLLMLENRVLCMRIRLPLHVSWPQPFGWVTVDDTSIGGKVRCKKVDPTKGVYH